MVQGLLGRWAALGAGFGEMVSRDDGVGWAGEGGAKGTRVCDMGLLPSGKKPEDAAQQNVKLGPCDGPAFSCLEYTTAKQLEARGTKERA